MKKLLITTAATLLTVAAFAQGTVVFSNNGGSKMSTGVSGSASTTWVVVPNSTAGVFDYGLFYGIGESTSLTLLSSALGVNSTSTAGLIASSADSMTPVNVLGIPGTSPSETDVWVQVGGWSASFGSNWQLAQAAAATTPGVYFGLTSVINVGGNSGGLGASTGPGSPMWQTATGTNPDEFKGGIVLYTAAVPEPSTMALAGLGMAALLIFRRRK